MNLFDEINRMIRNRFVREIIPEFKKIDNKTMQIGIVCPVYGDIIDCQLYYSKKDLTAEDICNYFEYYRDSLKRNGVI